MADSLPPDGQVEALLRRLNELIVEATRLRDDIASAMSRRIESPFWPDRRRERRPFPQERRRGR